MKSDAQKQQESQVETAGIRAEPAFREAFKEIQKQVKTFGESVVEEIHLIRGKLEAVEKEQDNQREMVYKADFFLANFNFHFRSKL